MSGYISEILSYEPNLMLGTTELDFLNRFLIGKCSAYIIHSELANPYVVLQDGITFSKNVHIFHRIDSKLLGKGMAYKNVHKRIKRLAELHLIEEFRYRYSGTHGAKFFKITGKGIFFLMYSSRLYPTSLRLENLIRYHGDSILETILFPYFEDESLTRYTVRFLFAMSSYLAECCEIMLGAIEDIKEGEDDEKKRRIAKLEYDLKRNTLSLAFELVNKFSPRALGYLASDKKFVNLVKELKAEFDNGYEVFASEVAKRRTLSRNNR